MEWSHVIAYSAGLDVFVTLLVTINPIAVLATYLSLTSHLGKGQKEVVLRQGILFALVVLLVSVFLGNLILKGLGLERYALQVAGGLLFFKFGWDAMQSRVLAEEGDDVTTGAVPLGFPVIAGPGSITAVILFSSVSSPALNGLYIALVFSVFFCLGVTYLLLKHAEAITSRLGKNATVAMVKITGLLIITLGIQLVMSGIAEWLHGL